ncbi:unnamed protein product [Calicophoron daubneyi]|uniref:Uncharacterized protein n=1 Tax=Calicophoron daubneyi TaxID=300641 RepID=A0AAV2TLI6_CALDB
MWFKWICVSSAASFSIFIILLSLNFAHGYPDQRRLDEDAMRLMISMLRDTWNPSRDDSMDPKENGMSEAHLKSSGPKVSDNRNFLRFYRSKPAVHILSNDLNWSYGSHPFTDDNKPPYQFPATADSMNTRDHYPYRAQKRDDLGWKRSAWPE